MKCGPFAGRYALVDPRRDVFNRLGCTRRVNASQPAPLEGRVLCRDLRSYIVGGTVKGGHDQ